MFDPFVGQKYPSITVQGVLLVSSMLYLTHGGQEILIILTVSIIMSLFVLQAINHRFFYYFPFNKFTGKKTKDYDTYLLYLMTTLVFLLFLWGLTDSFGLAFFLTAFILLPGFFWEKYGHEWIRDRITYRLKKESIIENVKCPYCGEQAIYIKEVHKWNEGSIGFKCDSCNKQSKEMVNLNIG